MDWKMEKYSYVDTVEQADSMMRVSFSRKRAKEKLRKALSSAFTKALIMIAA